MKTVLAEPSRARPVIDGRDRSVRLTPVMNVDSVVGNDMAVARAVGRSVAAVVKLEAIPTSGCAIDDLDLEAVESTSRQENHLLFVGHQGLGCVLGHCGRVCLIRKVLYALKKADLRNPIPQLAFYPTKCYNLHL